MVKRGAKMAFKLKNMKVRTQIILVFVIEMSLVLLLGLVSYGQTNQLNQQIETMYSHPFAVRNAFYKMEVATLDSGIELRNLTYESNLDAQEEIIIKINQDYATIESNYIILEENYLGPIEDVENVYSAYIAWKTYRNTTIDLIQSGENDLAIQRLESGGISDANRIIFLDAIQVVDDYSAAKAISLYSQSQILRNNLFFQLVLLVTLILLIKLTIDSLLMNQIQTPISKLTAAVHQFENGDFQARSDYESGNEFGVLSHAFNHMVGQIEEDLLLKEKINHFSSRLFARESLRVFFNNLLNELCIDTHSEAGAVYMLTPSESTYQLFDSFGMDTNIKKNISAEANEGEFGQVLYSKKMTRITDIPDDTIFSVSTIHGNMMPKNIIMIPIVINNIVKSILTLSSLHDYDDRSIEFIEITIEMICARTEGIFANEKANDFLIELESQNRELESQQSEMAVLNHELEEQNTALEVKKQQLHEANLHKTNFLSTMSHELRTPLNSVIALSGVLSRKLQNQISEEELSYLEVIERNGKNLLLLINDILDISRIESGKAEISIETFSPCKLIAELIENVKPLSQQKHIEIIHKCEINDILMESDQDKFRHIVQNLISNAVKFTEKGSVTVSTRQLLNQIEIIVKDTGIGISKDHLPFIFEEFRQADASTSRKYGGTGLGLAIVKKYTDLLQGKISVESTLNEGSSFVLLLPLKMNPTSSTGNSESMLNRYQKNDKLIVKSKDIPSKHLLIVDDNEPTLIQMKDLLENENYIIAYAKNAKEAFQLISKQKPDGVILDLMLPEVNGFEVLKQIRDSDTIANVPVLVLSAKQITSDELKELKRNNVHQLIQKGDVNHVELLNAITSILYPELIPQTKIPSLSTNSQPLVLIVEDNPDNMISAVALLKDDFMILEAVDGLQGVEQANKYLPDLILMDIALPVMDGIHAFRQIRLNPRCVNIPVIALTASAMVQDRASILAYGFDAFISKPLNDHDFIHTIKEILYGKK